MLSKLPRDHYVHIYLEEVRPYQFNATSVKPSDDNNVKENLVEPETNDNVDQEPSAEENIGEPSDDSNVGENVVEPETIDNVDKEPSAEENIGEPSDDGNVADSNSDLEDIDYEVSKSTSYESGFTDTENDLEDELDSKGMGDNVTREESHGPNRKGSDEVRVDSDPESGHSDSFHSLDESNSDGPHKKPQYPKCNTTTYISNLIGITFCNKTSTERSY
ncbi:hypothetical protein V6N12_029009 [Hibiscus sabdariffa]|uniref:Uncharacterized protein n=1 Tax=Hibiscus sabdariffa TaxID=183260 RepID=A0ABR2F7J4_9ROSI